LKPREGTRSSKNRRKIRCGFRKIIDSGVQVLDSLKAVLPDNEAARRRAIELATNLAKANLADLTIKTIQVANDEAQCFLECRSDARVKCNPIIDLMKREVASES
jgi:hypothetical protein